MHYWRVLMLPLCLEIVKNRQTLMVDGDPDLFTFRDSDERFSIVQPYVQFKWRLSKKN